MKRTWNVSATIVGSQHVGTYDAETGEEAIEMAGEDVSTSFCHQCTSKIENAECESMTAESGEDLVSDEETWEDRARKAGWRPPAKKRAQKEKSK